LLAGDRGGLLLYENEKFLRLGSGTRQNLRCVSFSSKSGPAYACGNRGTFLRIDGEGATVLRTEQGEKLRRLSWNHEGDRGLMVGSSGVAYTIDKDENLRSVSGAETHLRSVSWYPDQDAAVVTGNCFRDSIGSLSPSPNLFELREGTLNEISSIEESRADLTCSSWRPGTGDCLLGGFDQTWHTPALSLLNKGNIAPIRWDVENTFPTACAWDPSGDFALIGTGRLTESEGAASLYRYEPEVGITKVADTDGYGISSIAWLGGGPEEAMITCSRTLRAFSA
jgi:hypothetical protein